MAIRFPAPGRLHFSNLEILSDPDNPECRKLISTLFVIPDVYNIRICLLTGSAEIRFDARCRPEEFSRKVGDLLSAEAIGNPLEIPQTIQAGPNGVVELHRHLSTLSTWKVAHDLPGRIRLRNPRIFRRKELCNGIERELMSVLGVQRFKVNPVTCSVLVFYDPEVITSTQIVRFLDRFLCLAEPSPYPDRNSHELLVCTGALGLATTAQFWIPSLLIPAAVLLAYCSIPTFLGARDVLWKDRRLGVDVLDAIVVIMCLFTMQVFAGAVLSWCLGFGRRLLDKAQEDSRRQLVNVFGKQPCTVYLYKDGVEINVSVDELKAGDIIVVHTGEMIAADGVVADGVAIIDQHALTGESVPVEKEIGSKVYASTVVIGGRILVQVEKAGKETTSAKIAAILNETVTFRLTSQSRGEALADQAVVPTLALGALGLGIVGVKSATAIVNCDFGTGIRMAAPLALLSCLSVCSKRGILVKDGRALEQMSTIDTVLFDKTGTLTHEKPTVHEIHRSDDFDEHEILALAAAAERHLAHPIAAAIVDRFRETGEPFPATDHSSYKMGYGIDVMVEGRRVLVGSNRFMKMENVVGLERTADIERETHAEGHSIVFVAVDGKVAGAIELAPRLRPGVRDVIEGLRALGVKQVVIISGDHQTPTRKLADSLGVDRYFAEVLPEDKAKYVELLQSEGRKVCFVGDGINDSIALKRANVSVSLKGATSVATDTAQLVFMEDNLWKLCEFMEVSRNLDRNVKTSWGIILVPNLLCIGGAFFLGFGVMASVMANNVAAIAALVNGIMARGMRLNDAAGIGTRHRGVYAPASRHGTESPRSGLEPYDLEQFLDALPEGMGIKKAASFLSVAGFAGFVVPGIPGWPLILVAIALFSASRPDDSAVDRWLRSKFPLLREEALHFAFNLFLNMKRRFPNPSAQSGSGNSR
jgi:heavy metal translocating P-type ATPase